MGGLCPGGQPGSAEERKQSAQIDSELRQFRKEFEHEVKLLLLGAGESGKSTIAKQMKIIHLEGYTEAERAAFRDVVHSNIVMCIKSLLQACENFELKLNKKNKDKAEAIKQLEAMSVLTPELGKDMKDLWNDKAIQKTFDRANEFQLFDSTAYWFQNIDRIADPSFVPNEQDILRARTKTTGITEIDFEVENTKFRMVDVGGQRSERKKWIHCFQEVTAVIFCVAMSEYDLKLYEDESVNRMHESLKLFDEICNSRWFSSVSLILFLNKSDLFRDKIKKVNLNVCFPEFDGGLDYDRASEFVQTKFVNLNKSPDQKQVYPHITCATDTNNIRFVFNAVKNIILHQALDASGF